jgi:RHS repeat-associated protein
VPGGFEVHRDSAGRITQSIATVSGTDGVAATVSTNYNVSTGAPLAQTGTNVTSPISGPLTLTKLALKDHLGSMVAEVTITGALNAAGQVSSVSLPGVNALVVHGFGPWGNARNTSLPLAEGSRGFTGHEHLADLGLIHMNGRIYDPVIGRFLQADPIIQAPGNAQSHNRYSYVLNNPLSFTDPSGFSAWTKWRRAVVGVVAGILTAGLATWAMGAYAYLNGATLFASASGTLNGLGMATAAAAGGFASGGIMGGNIQSALRGAFTAFVTAGVLQGIGELMSSGGAAAGTDAALSSGSFDHLSANGNGVVQSPVSGMQVGAAVSDACLSCYVRVETVVTSAAKEPWYGGALDWLANGPSDRSTIGGAVWMGMMAGSGGRLSGVARGASALPKAASAAERLVANQAAGKVGEDFLKNTYGGAQEVTKQTSLRARRIDTLADGVAMESKVGRTSLTTRVEAQIAKDVELMAMPRSGVDAVEWHFFPGKSGFGPTAPLMNKLLNCGITVCMHP